MKHLAAIMVLLLLAGGFAAEARASEVVQGKCIRFDPAAQTVVIEEYDTNFTKEWPYGNPTGILFEGDTRTARIGIRPEPGDILRVAYKLEGDRKQVLKIMNVSKQDLMKK